MSASLTTTPTLFTAKSTANDVGDTTHWDGDNANDLQSQDQLVVQSFPRTQTVGITTSGAVTFLATWRKRAPVNFVLVAKNTNGGTLLQSSYRITRLASSTTCTARCKSNAAAAGSAYATVYYR
jgi:hypothetical protein